MPARLRRPAEIVGVQDHQVGGFVVHVDAEADQPAVVLGALGAARPEAEFARMASGAEVARFGDAFLAVVATEPRGGDSHLDVVPAGSPTSAPSGKRGCQ